jgi:hypothetical protein
MRGKTIEKPDSSRSNQNETIENNRTLTIKEGKEKNYVICKIIESQDSSKCSLFRNKSDFAEKECVISFANTQYLQGILKNRQCSTTFCGDEIVLNTLQIAKDECNDFCKNIASCGSIQNEKVRLICRMLNGESDLCADALANSGCQDTVLMLDAIKNSNPSKLDSVNNQESIIVSQIRRMLSGEKCDAFYKK